MKTKILLAAFAALFGSLAQAQTASPLADARAALQADDLARADTLLAPLTGPVATDAAAFFTLGQLRDRQKNHQDAVAAYEQATRLDATQPEYFASLGIALSQRMAELPFMQQAMAAGKLKKAFEKAVQLDPGNIAGLIGLARFYANAPEIAGGSPEKAAEFADRVKALVPFLGEFELGNIAEKGEDFGGALARYESAAQLNPGHAPAHLASGRMLAKLGRKEEARARFETALKLKPNLEPAKKALAELDAPAAAKG